LNKYYLCIYIAVYEPLNIQSDIIVSFTQIADPKIDTHCFLPLKKKTIKIKSIPINQIKIMSILTPL